MCFFFFFQAEDGIRDRSPSRGLGDVYKRQEWEDEIKNRSEIISRKKLEVRIYTFVTCSYERENNRTYVYAIERKNTK